MTWAKNIHVLPGNIGPTPYIGPWDYVIIGGETSPGVARLDVRVPSGVDVQKAKGSKKSFTVDEGDPPIEMELTLQLQPDDLEEFFLYIFPFFRPSGKATGRDPFTIEHPMAALVGVTNVIAQDCDLPQPKPGGLMVVSVDLVEWSPKPVEATTTGKVQSNGATAKKPMNLENDYGGILVIDPYTGKPKVPVAAGQYTLSPNYGS